MYRYGKICVPLQLDLIIHIKSNFINFQFLLILCQI